MHHKNIIDELMAHEPTEQKDKPAKVGDPRLDEKLEKAVQEAENLEACAVKSQKNKTKSETDIENLCEEIDQLKNQLLRAAAELQNTQTRAEREINNAHKFALEQFSKALLPIADNLERALENTPQNDPHVEGVQLTLQLFLSTLEKFGVEPIYPINKPFDPELHEALSIQQVPNVKSNTVIQVFEKGYLLNGRLIRPAKVIVAA